VKHVEIEKKMNIGFVITALYIIMSLNLSVLLVKNQRIQRDKAIALHDHTRVVEAATNKLLMAGG